MWVVEQVNITSRASYKVDVQVAHVGEPVGPNGVFDCWTPIVAGLRLEQFPFLFTGETTPGITYVRERNTGWTSVDPDFGKAR